MVKDAAPEINQDANTSMNPLVDHAGDAVMNEAADDNTQTRTSIGDSFASLEKFTVGKFEIDLTRPLGMFAHEFADAFECTGTDTGISDHVAVIIKGRYPIRREYTDILIANNNVSRVMELRLMQVVSWPDEGQKCVLIFRRPAGNPLFARHRSKSEAMSEELVKKAIIRPIVQMLRGFSHVGLFHGNIRPDTIFLTNQENAEATLIECVSSAPGVNQPITFETVERAMASRYCRGNGTTADDIYALGVSVAILLRGSNPLQAKNDKQILEDKLNFGSYVLFVDGLRLTPSLNEFLRGTLNDDARQRWGLDQILAWLDGNRTTTKLASAAVKAQRALDFNGKKYTKPRMLAKDLYDNPAEAMQLIENGQLLRWIERAINDQMLHDTVSAAIQQANTAGRSTGFEDRLICYVSMALDPFAPIRYKELRVFPNGIGYGMAFAYINNQPMQSFAELLRDRYAWHWLHHKDNFSTRFNALSAALDNASKQVIRRGINFGLERCLYELCPDTPCLSDMFQGDYVLTCRGLLLALDHVADQYRSDRSPIDRHIASFIVTEDMHDNGGMLAIVDGTDRVRRSLATLTLLQQLQKRYDVPKLEALARWLGKDAEIIVERFNDQQLKKSILKYLPKEIKTGDLYRVLSLVDNPLQVKKDIDDFSYAGKQYKHYSTERENIRMQLDLNPKFGYESGQQIAMIISFVLSGIIIAATLLMHFGR